jgi:hypothetical protein
MAEKEIGQVPPGSLERRLYSMPTFVPRFGLDPAISTLTEFESKPFHI